MLKPIMKDGIPTCPCGCQSFSVGCQELVYYELDMSQKGEGWGESEPVENVGKHPYVGMVCQECDEDVEVTPEVEQFLFSIGG